VWVVAVVLLLAVLASGCLGLYVTLPPSEVPQWPPAVRLALVALRWAFCIFSTGSMAIAGAAARQMRWRRL
jgi:hypothetical protein